MGTMDGSMQYVNLGRTGLKVSRLCLGTMNYGPYASEAESHAQMDKALDLGINFFDTADVYGWKKGEGVTEQILGRYFAQGGGRRDRVVLATKVFGDMDLPGKPDPNFARGLSARKIVLACENSLKRMQDPWGREIFWIGGGSAAWSGHENSDFRAIQEGYISVTPLHLDLTHHSLLASAATWWQDL